MNLYRVDCITCGWWNQNGDEKAVEHSGVVHSTMLRPGHVVVGAEPKERKW